MSYKTLQNTSCFACFGGREYLECKINPFCLFICTVYQYLQVPVHTHIHKCEHDKIYTTSPFWSLFHIKTLWTYFTPSFSISVDVVTSVSLVIHVHSPPPQYESKSSLPFFRSTKLPSVVPPLFLLYRLSTGHRSCTH